MSRHDGRTEQPTARRLRQAREQGQVARSQEPAVAASLLMGVLVVAAVGPTTWTTWELQVARLLTLRTSVDDLSGDVGSLAAAMAVVGIVPFLVGAVLAGLAAGVPQVGLRPRPKLLVPKWSRVGPKAGLNRLKPSVAGWELARSTVKLGALAALLWGPVSAWTDTVQRGWTFAGGIAATAEMLTTLLIRALGIALVVAAADYLWNRRRTARDLRMTKDEVRREVKDQMGDPLMRSRRAERARHLSRNRMMAAVGEADVVVTNPTHLAVALRYTPTEPAPRVVAKGADRMAARIRGEARRHGVGVVEDVGLARALFRRCRPGDFVPHTLYEAVAVVLATAYRRGRTRPGARVLA